MDRDYVLGTHKEELARLGLQHRVWRPVVLDCWQRAGITVGKRVLDVGAGPGYATVDLAEIVGPTGEIIALERSENFIRAIEQACRVRSLSNVKIRQLDLVTDELPEGNYDFSWCRWVMSFVNDPALFIQKLGDVMRRGSVAIFHEYGHYEDLAFFPRLAHQERLPRTCDRNVARVRRRARRSSGTGNAASRERLHNSLRKTTHVLCASRRLHVAMARYVH